MLYMNELTSTEFRKVYASLREPVVVTVNGHPIGTWTPFTKSQQGDLQDAMPTSGWPQGARAQAKRDDLLRKINRSK